MTKQKTASEAVALIADNATIAVILPNLAYKELMNYDGCRSVPLLPLTLLLGAILSSRQVRPSVAPKQKPTTAPIRGRLRRYHGTPRGQYGGNRKHQHEESSGPEWTLLQVAVFAGDYGCPDAAVVPARHGCCMHVVLRCDGSSGRVAFPCSAPLPCPVLPCFVASSR